MEENDIKCERVIMEIRHYSNSLSLFNHYGKWLFFHNEKKNQKEVNNGFPERL